MRAGVEGRSRVHQLVATQSDDALTVAKTIAHPWYRCQALSEVGETLADPARALEVVRQAIASAHELEEPNRIVTVAGWPLRVLVARSIGDPSAEVDQLLEIISTEPHSLRRADALFALLNAIFARKDLRDRVLEALTAALSVSHAWRSERLRGFTVLLIAGESLETAARIYRQMPESKAKRRTQREMLSRSGVGARWIELAPQ